MWDVSLLLHDLGLGKEVAELVHEGFNENEIGAIKGALSHAYKTLEVVEFEEDSVSFSKTYRPNPSTNGAGQYGVKDLDSDDNMTLAEAVKKYDLFMESYGTGDGGAVLVYIAKLKTTEAADFYHLSDYAVSSHVSGPGLVMVPITRCNPSFKRRGPSISSYAEARERCYDELMVHPEIYDFNKAYDYVADRLDLIGAMNTLKRVFVVTDEDLAEYQHNLPAKKEFPRRA
jgi:hypothetical protein